MNANIQAIRDAQRQGLIKGLGSLGPPQIRLEIDEFIQDVDMTNLFLLAMIEIMKDGVWQDPFSWFQMGGMSASIPSLSFTCMIHIHPSWIFFRTSLPARRCRKTCLVFQPSGEGSWATSWRQLPASGPGHNNRA
jgi:hypothetical protein